MSQQRAFSEFAAIPEGGRKHKRIIHGWPGWSWRRDLIRDLVRTGVLRRYRVNKLKLEGE